jgi:polyphosphate kinase
MVRVAGLLDQVAAGLWETSSGEMPPGEQLKAIRPFVEMLMGESRSCLLNDLIPALAERGVEIVD